MPDTITVYEKPTCTKCREMDRFLRESGFDFSKINYYIEPLSEKKLRELIKKMGITPRDLLRTSETIYRELELGKKDLSDDEIISLMVKHPDLMHDRLSSVAIARCSEDQRKTSNRSLNNR